MRAPCRTAPPIPHAEAGSSTYAPSRFARVQVIDSPPGHRTDHNSPASPTVTTGNASASVASAASANSFMLMIGQTSRNPPLVMQRDDVINAAQYQFVDADPFPQRDDLQRLQSLWLDPQ